MLADAALPVPASLVTLLVPAGEPAVVAIDGTLFRRRSKKVRAVAAVIVRLPARSRPAAIPVLAKLVIKDTSSASRLWLARRMAAAIAAALPGRHIHVALTRPAPAGS